MPPVTPQAPPAPPALVECFFALTVEELKWYAAVVANKPPLRKGELVVLLTQTLTDKGQAQALWERLSSVQQQVVAEAAHHLGGRFDGEVIRAKYPEAVEPASRYGYLYTFGLGRSTPPATPYDLFFVYND